MQPTVSDRSFQYGDGVFTTIRICDAQPHLWRLHWQRLQNSMQRLGMSPVQEQDVLTLVHAAITSPEQVVKVLISRGQGGRGYSPAGIIAPQIYVTSSALPNYLQWQQQGIQLGVAELKLACQPRLAGIKHTSRLENVLLKAEVETSGYDDLIALDHHHHVIELSAANLFFCKDQQWHTPFVDQAGVAGVMRQSLLEQFDVKQGCYTLDDLCAAQAVFACNALMGVVPVRQILQHTYAVDAVKPIQQLVPFIRTIHA